MADAIAELDARNAAVKEAEQRAAEKAARETAERRDTYAEEYAASEQGATRAQQVEAERIMRLSTPETLKALGSRIGDPTKGPSS